MRAKRKGADNLAEKVIKDKTRTSHELGITITGMNVDGKKAMFKKTKEVTVANCKDYLIKPFIHEGKLNKEAVDYCVAELDKMIVHFDTVNTFEVRGASIFFVLDHIGKNYCAKLIDLASFEETGQQDKGFLHGLVTLRKLILESSSTQP